MRNSILHSILLIVMGGFSMTAQAQQVYRCGKTYNQIPCPSGTAVDTSDARTQKQRVDSQKATARDTELANHLEKARQQEEAMAAAGRTPAEKKSKGKTAKSGKTKNKKINQKEPELFTAAAAPEKKKKKTASPRP
jgi:hypothetical protein